VRVPLGNVRIVDVRIGNHRLIDLIQIDNDLCEVLRIGIRRQRRLFTGPDFGNALVSPCRSGPAEPCASLSMPLSIMI
jgi:hypothetical protein